MAQDHIETRTPEEMLAAIYARLIARGRAFSAEYDHNYSFAGKYRFPFDRNSVYTYGGWKEWEYYPDEHMILFRRESDGHRLHMTIFSQPPERIQNG